ncbi:hypothetical protein F9L33_08720 [Amylibacter sp. SFDW26]|uniref:hypothetical protein n=1 Tax=Amylibacter sp. SFDW26 TaxID=2652722 RepID=UPI00126282AD|nr:hypothetical protein [Amylibacter sp. SFDW26]KAB7614701.1 hypothetical protein F9L33_08720 [Amylibacter sp. SFDW26]
MSEDTSFDNVDKRNRSNRKKREIALILPIIGTFLLLTPIVKVFTKDDGNSSLITTLLFIFGVWALLIAAAYFLSRALAPEIREK